MLQLSAVLEAYFIASRDGLTTARLLDLIRLRIDELRQAPPSSEVEEELSRLVDVTAQSIETAIGELNAYYSSAGRAFQVLETATGWRIYTTAECAPYLEHLRPTPPISKLSQAALETLAIIAYRQPITKAMIESVRGVSSDAMVQKLIDADLVSISGRSDLPGRPILYQTTPFFFEHFGVTSIDDLPNSQELRNMAWPTSTDQADASDQLHLGDYHEQSVQDGM